MKFKQKNRRSCGCRLRPNKTSYDSATGGRPLISNPLHPPRIERRPNRNQRRRSAPILLKVVINLTPSIFSTGSRGLIFPTTASVHLADFWWVFVKFCAAATSSFWWVFAQVLSLKNNERKNLKA
ncbi:hypothetical protein ABFX02_09G041000 [Erythranthe guttata]